MKPVLSLAWGTAMPHSRVDLAVIAYTAYTTGPAYRVLVPKRSVPDLLGTCTGVHHGPYCGTGPVGSFGTGTERYRDGEGTGPARHYCMGSAWGYNARGAINDHVRHVTSWDLARTPGMGLSVAPISSLHTCCIRPPNAGLVPNLYMYWEHWHTCTAHTGHTGHTLHTSTSPKGTGRYGEGTVRYG